MNKEVKGLTLRGNFSWTFVGNTVYAFCQWLILIVLARLGNVEMVGHFTLALAICGPLFIFSRLQLRTIQATDTHQRYKVSEYMGLRIITTTFSLIFLAALLFILNYPKEIILIVFIFGLTKGIESIGDIYYGALQQRERMDRIAVSMMLRGIIAITIISIFTFFDFKLSTSLMLVVFAWTFVLFFYDFKSAKKIVFQENIEKFKQESFPSFNKKKLKSIFVLALPLAIGVLITSLITNTPRYFVEYILDAKALGYFGAISFIGIGADRISSALGQAAKPRLAKLHVYNKDGFWSLITKLIVLCVGLGILGLTMAWWLGEWLLNFVYGAEYSQFHNILMWISVGVVFQLFASILNASLQAVRAFWVHMYTSGITLLIVLVAAWPLIAKFGILGGGILVALGAVSSTVISTVYLFRVAK